MLEQCTLNTQKKNEKSLACSTSIANEIETTKNAQTSFCLTENRILSQSWNRTRTEEDIAQCYIVKCSAISNLWQTRRINLDICFVWIDRMSCYYYVEFNSFSYSTANGLPYLRVEVVGKSRTTIAKYEM